MDVREELKSHIETNFALGLDRVFLTETRSVVDGIDDIVNDFMRTIKPQLIETCKSENSVLISKIYEKNIILNKIPLDFKIELKTQIKEKKGYSGGLNSKETLITDKEGNAIFKPNILLTCVGPDYDELYYVVAFSIAHELTHTYNCYRYFIENGFDEFLNNIKNTQNYTSISKHQSGIYSDNIQKISTFLYNLNRMERNAYIAQLRQELLANKDKLTNNRTILDAIYSTESFKKLLECYYLLEWLFSIKDETEQKYIIAQTNKVMNKTINFKTYNQLLKYFNNTFNKWKKAYIIKASKIAYDIFDENTLMIY